MNKNKVLTKVAQILRDIIIALLILIPLCIGIDLARELYQESSQTSYIHQYWLPASSEVTTDRGQWDKKIAEADVEVIYDFNRFKKDMEDQKCLILVERDKVSYATFHGKMALVSNDAGSYGPSATYKLDFRYIGEGKVEYQIKRFWISVIGTPIIQATIEGAIIDAGLVVAGFALYILWVIIWKRSSKGLRTFSDLVDADTNNGGNIVINYKVSFRGKMQWKEEVNKIMRDQLRLVTSEISEKEILKIEERIKSQIPVVFENGNSMLSELPDNRCRLVSIEIPSVIFAWE